MFLTYISKFLKMKSKLIIFSFTLFFFNSVQSICVPRNSSTRSPSPNTPPNLKPVSSSPKAPTPSSPSPPLPSRKDPAPAPKASSPAPKASSTSPLPQSLSPASSPDSSSRMPDLSLLKRPTLNSITSALPKLGGGKDSPTIQKICQATDYPDICLKTLGPVSGPANDVSAVLGVAIKAGSDFAKTALDTATKLAGTPGMPPDEASPIKDCKDSYDDVSYNFQNAADALAKKDVGTLNTMLSAALTDVGDCQDAFEGQISPLTTVSETLRKMASNCLAMVEQMNK